MKRLEKNKEEVKSKRKDKQESKLDTFNVKKKNKAKNLKKETKLDTGYEVGFVIDASIAGIEDLHDIIFKICATSAKLVLTSITVKELEKMQKFKDIDGKGARHILAIAAENDKNFYTVLIDENFENPDECIIKYCADHKDNVVLLTADKAMSLKARMYNVKTKYFKHNNSYTYSNDQPLVYTAPITSTLGITRSIGGKLCISDFNNDYRRVIVISNGIEYTEGICELKIGDDVYLTTKKTQYLTFAHYKMTALSLKNNCKLIYSKKIYNISEIEDLPKVEYKSFIRGFKCNHDL